MEPFATVGDPVEAEVEALAETEGVTDNVENETVKVREDIDRQK